MTGHDPHIHAIWKSRNPEFGNGRRNAPTTYDPSPSTLQFWFLLNHDDDMGEPYQMEELGEPYQMEEWQVEELLGDLLEWT